MRGGPQRGAAPDPGEAADMADVAALCELARVAGRLGCRVRLLDVPPPLYDLLRLAGVSEVLTGYAAGVPSTDETPARRDHRAGDLGEPEGSAGLR